MNSEIGPIMDPEKKERRTLARTLYSQPFAEDSTVRTILNNGPGLVAALFGPFKGEKLKLVQSIGFDIFLRLPVHHRYDDAFYLSLLRKVDPSARCLQIDMGTHHSRQLVFRDEDINLVFGLPHIGSRVDSEGEVSMQDFNAVRNILFLDGRKSKISNGYIESILTRDYGFPMTAPKQNAFRVAVVMYTMVNFLAVRGGSKRVPTEIFGSLVNPSLIKHVNWCGNVRRTLLSEAERVQDKIKRGHKVIAPGGCSLYAKICYLDNLSLDELNISARTFPRALLFSRDVISLDIRLDYIISPTNGSRVFGQSMIKRESNVCYSSYSLQSGYDDIAKPERKVGKRKRAGIIGLEGNWISINPTARRIIASADIMKPCVLPDIGIVKCQLGCSPLSNIPSPNIDVSPNQDQSLDTITPFEIKFNHHDKPFHTWFTFFDALKDGKVSMIEWEWFRNSEPYEIIIIGWALRAALIPGGYFPIKVTDAILRVFMSRDNARYFLKPKRWRHYIPARWTDTVLHRSFGTKLLAQMKYFVGPHILYDASYCKMDMKDKKAIVLDPQMQMCPVKDIKRCQRKVLKELHTALFSVIEHVFPEWKISCEDWTNVYRNDVGPRCKWADSGLYSVHYVDVFDGNELTDSTNNGYEHNRRAKIVWMILAMSGNSGNRPHEFTKLMYSE